uniref:NADH dehydrogenase subunit 11 n=1 Tax=Laminaria rodriguezii TaxID=1740620 RepID=A0A7U1G3K2_9PHAE|nr:NADH dehydrogenase subunit 11 [Laminaria rodriguezii]QQY84995.1 NADH dehydrogenase subunit 11 [Laminaria rodriguezii]
MLNISINELLVWIKKGSTVIQACQAAGANIPRFCYHDKLFIAGNCRMCLVEVSNSPKPQASCALPFLPNLRIFTNTALVRKAQESVMELLLLHHPLDCPVCDQGGECELQEQSFNFGSDRGRFLFFKNSLGDTFWGGLIKTVLRRCIVCTRCVRYTYQIGGNDSLGTSNRGGHSEIGMFKESVLKSEMSGGVIELCPVCWYNSRLIT